MQNCVAAKLSNTRYLIKRSMRDAPEINADGALTDCISYLESGIKSVYEMKDKEMIMGVEGSCAKAYFDIFDRLIRQQKEEFKLLNRTKRPPLDRVNAMLSFLYTIAVSWHTSALESVGLDSCCGFYHSLRPGRASLACDMVEETRCICERLVLTMINLKMIKAEDFETQPSGAVYLSKDGKKKGADGLAGTQARKDRPPISGRENTAGAAAVCAKLTDGKIHTRRDKRVPMLSAEVGDKK